MLLILSASEIFGKIPKKIKTAIEMAVLLFMIVISSIRLGPLGDYDNYEMLFLNINTGLNIVQALREPVMLNTEPLYNILNYTVKFIGGDFRTFVAIEAVLVNVLFYAFCKTTVYKDDNKDYTLTVFFTMWGLRLFNIFIVRQTIAIAICWLGMKHIRKHHFIKFALYVAVAAMFHRSALIWIAAYWAYWVKSENKRRQIQYLMLILAASTGFGILARPISRYLPGMLGFKVRMYMDIGMSGFGSAFSVLLTLLKTFVNIGVILIIIMFLFHNMKKNEFFLGLANIYELGAAIVFATSFTANQLARLAQPFTMISIFIYPYLFCKTSKSNKIILYAVFIVYIGARLYLNIMESSVMLDGYSHI